MGVTDRDGNDGSTVAAALFNQRFFEHTLNWDFESVWQWDAKENRPALRPFDKSKLTRSTDVSAQSTGSVNTLVLQVKANIWL